MRGLNQILVLKEISSYLWPELVSGIAVSLHYSFPQQVAGPRDALQVLMLKHSCKKKLCLPVQPFHTLSLCLSSALVPPVHHFSLMLHLHLLLLAADGSLLCSPAPLPRYLPSLPRCAGILLCSADH